MQTVADAESEFLAAHVLGRIEWLNLIAQCRAPPRLVPAAHNHLHADQLLLRQAPPAAGPAAWAAASRGSVVVSDAPAPLTEQRATAMEQRACVAEQRAAAAEQRAQMAGLREAAAEQRAVAAEQRAVAAEQRADKARTAALGGNA